MHLPNPMVTFSLKQTRGVLIVLLSCAIIAAAPLSLVSSRAESGHSTAPFPSHPSKDAIKWANNQLKKMSLAEKIGQLFSIGVNASFMNQDSDAYKTILRHVKENHIGGVILFRGPVYESTHLMNRMQSESKYPLLISADLEAGSGMRFDDTINFPWNMAVGATGNPDYARKQGAVTAREARAMGVQHVYAPVADVNNNAANPVINVRSYGEDPVEVGKFTAAFVQGIQQGGAMATAKHFPGHGNTAVDSHRGLPIIDLSLDELNRIELVPFRAAIEAGVGSIMVGHIALPKIDPTAVTPIVSTQNSRPTYADTEVFVDNATLPATMSPVIGNLLKRDLKFDGIVVTDALDMSGLTIYFKNPEAGVRALLAGADMLLKMSDVDGTVVALKEAVKSGRVTELRIEESVRKILAAKYDLGLVKKRIAPLDDIDRTVSSREAGALANEIAEHAITLVRNDANLVPISNLNKDARILNLVITNGEDRTFISNPFVAAMNRTGHRVETIALDDRSSDAEVQRAIQRARSATVVLASLYGRVRTGQSKSVGLPDPGVRALNTLIDSGLPVIGISFGNPYLLQGFPHMKTYVVAYGDMQSLQEATARALAGEIDITARLPISLPGLYPRGTGIQLKAQK